MDGETLTDRRISSAAQAVLDQVEAGYETVFADVSADDEFFSDLEDAFGFFLKRTSKRPIKPREVKAAQTKFRDSCRTIMKKARQRV